MSDERRSQTCGAVSPLARLIEAAEHVLAKYEPEKREGCWELQELERVVAEVASNA